MNGRGPVSFVETLRSGVVGLASVNSSAPTLPGNLWHSPPATGGLRAGAPTPRFMGGVVACGLFSEAPYTGMGLDWFTAPCGEASAVTL